MRDIQTFIDHIKASYGIAEHDIAVVAQRLGAVFVATTAAWTAPQLREAFPEDAAPRYLVHDRDDAFAAVATTARGMGIEEIRTAPRSPWQNA